MNTEESDRTLVLGSLILVERGHQGFLALVEQLNRIQSARGEWLQNTKSGKREAAVPMSHIDSIFVGTC